MATTQKMDVNGFLVVNSGAVDIASNGAVASVNTVITVTAPDGTANPLLPGDIIILAAGLDTLSAGVAVQNCAYTSAGTVTLRTTNPSAGAVDPPSIAAGLLQFLVFRR